MNALRTVPGHNYVSNVHQLRQIVKGLKYNKAVGNDGIHLRSISLLLSDCYGQDPPSLESTTTECGVNYQLLAVITEVAKWELLVAVDHNQLRTMASETVISIDWSHSPPSWEYGLSASCTV